MDSIHGLDCVVCGKVGRHECVGGEYFRIDNGQLVKATLHAGTVTPWAEMFPLTVANATEANAVFKTRLAKLRRRV